MEQSNKSGNKKPAAKSKGKKKNSALAAAAVARSATEQVLPRADRSLSNTGTTISYEEGTEPGAGG